MKKTLITFLLIFFALTGFSQNIQFEKYELSNGLDVILHEDHSTPLVSVNIWYHVGSKNEKPGRTGFAHLFEHLMFEGSKNAPEGMFDKWLEAAGGDNNGSTTNDRTNYYENVPSNALELALYLESDRMANLLDAIDQEKLDLQRDVVKNERRQGVDNQPYGLVDEILSEALYPPSHPYSWSVIGSMEDLSAATLEDVQNFFKKYYAPNNASLSIAGDFDPAEVKVLVEKYFGSIPPGTPVIRPQKWIPKLDGEKVISMEDNVSLARVYIAWHTPPFYAQGDAELDILASILTNGKNSRLYKSLVYDQQIAQDVTAYQASRDIASDFNIIATAKQGVDLETLKKAIDTELTKLVNEPPSQKEITAALNDWEAGFVRRIQSVGGFGGKANLLNQYNFFVGTPDYFKKDMQRYLSIKPVDVQNIVKKYLKLDERVVVNVTPQGDLTAKENADLDRTQLPKSSESVALTIPDIQKKTLDNGLKVLLVEQHELPLVQMNLLIKSGWTADPDGFPGVSSLTSDLMDEGTKNRSALDISQDLKEIGADLGTSSSFDESTVHLNMLKKQLVPALDIFADVLVNPTFPKEELDRKKQQYLGRIMQEKRQPFTAAFKSFLKVLYGNDHPYGQPYTGTGTEESINAIEQKQLVEFYKTNFRPNNSTLIVVGDLTMDELVPALEKSLKGWKKKDVPTVTIPEIKPVEKSVVYIIDKPQAPQSVIVLGHLGLLKSSPNYFDSQVMNTILGGKFTSRLNQNLREDKGYTYGARSFFMFNKEVGPFIAYAQVQAEHTIDSINEFVSEFKGIAGDKPLPAEELNETKDYMTLRYPRGFETITQIAGKIEELVSYDLDKTYIENYIQSVQGVSNDDVLNAGKMINPDKMIYMIVGDAASIEAGIKELNIGEICYLDMDGNPIN